MVLTYKRLGSFLLGNMNKKTLETVIGDRVFTTAGRFNGFNYNYFLFSGAASDFGTSPMEFFGGYPLWF
jgi:hypothetical protein